MTYALILILPTTIGFLLFGRIGMIIGLLLGVFINSILLLLNSKKPLSQKEIEKFERKYNRTITDDDIKLQQRKFEKYGQLSLVFLAIIVTVGTFLLRLNAIFEFISNF